MAFFVASEPNSGVLKQLVADAVAQSVVLILNDDGALESLARIIFVRDPKKNETKMELLTL